MEIYTSEIYKALGYLVISGIIFFTWKESYNATKNNSLWRVLLIGFLICGGIALFSSVSLGGPSCEVESNDGYGGCEQFADNDFEPTTEDRIATFIYYITLLYIPVVSGAINGNKKHQYLRKKTLEESEFEKNYLKALDQAIKEGQTNTAKIQSDLHLGFREASKIIDRLEEEKIIESAPTEYQTWRKIKASHNSPSAS